MSKRLEDTEALSTRAMKKLSENQKIIQEQAQLIKEKGKDSKVILETVENLKEKQRAHAEIAKRLEEAEAAMNKLSMSPLFLFQIFYSLQDYLAFLFFFFYQLCLLLN